MANVLMWWAQTRFAENASGAGASVSFGLGGGVVSVSGSVNGPPSPLFNLAEAGFNIQVTGFYWLGPDRVPPTGCEWESLATDMTTGSITGLTRGGIWPLGPWPLTQVNISRQHRVFSGGALLVQEPFSSEQIIFLGDENLSQTRTLPSFGAFPRFSSSKFDFDRSKGLNIELQWNCRIFMRGDGRVTFSGVNVDLPQFLISSTL
jgi:hypothetical protein